MSEHTHLLLSFSSVVSLYPQMACFHTLADPWGTFLFKLRCNSSAKVYDPLMWAV
jgi:hypothetical protein